MVFEVKCANCNLYFPLDNVKQAGDGYYCKACYKRLKNRQCVPITSNMEVRCARCDKIISPDEAKVKDGDHDYCLRCYISSQVPPREEAGPDIVDDILERLHIAPPQDGKKPVKGKAKDKMLPDPQCTCAACGKTLSRHYDNPILDGGKYYCKECYEKAANGESVEGLMSAREFRRRGATAVRDADKLIECLQCGMFITLDHLREDKDGKVRCPKCSKILPIRFRGTWEARNNQSLKPDDIAAKKEEYAATAQLFKCLGDPCRVKIIELLSDHELCVFEFVEMTGFQYSAISYHLKMLKDLGMVKSYERGNFMVYSLTEKGETVHEFIEKSKGLS